MKTGWQLTESQKQAIDRHILDGKRIEIVPTKEGVKIFDLNRKEIRE